MEKRLLIVFIIFIILMSLTINDVVLRDYIVIKLGFLISGLSYVGYLIRELLKGK